ncbi:MAG TPA: VWA domain-containing protein [Herpetosiphonaceae bacterium]
MSAEPQNLLLLLALFPLAAMFWFAWRASQRDRAALGDETLVGTLLHSSTRRLYAMRVGLGLLAVGLIVIALSRPRWGESDEVVSRSGLQIMILLDGSTSMNTEDVRPSRLEASKAAVLTMLEQLEGNQIGMVMFGKTSYVQFPLTTDLAAAATLVRPISTRNTALGSTDLASAIRDGKAAFPIGQVEGRTMVLITDGGDPDPQADGEAVAAAREAAAAGLTIYTVGAGTTDGGPIPIYDDFGSRTFVEDDSGQQVETKLNEALLEQIASATGGDYVRVDDFDIERFQQSLQRLAPVDLNDQTRRRASERFYVFAGLALLVLVADVLLARRGVA